MRRDGRPYAPRTLTWVDAFWYNVTAGDGCWRWGGATTPKGYGVFTTRQRESRRRAYLAHRTAWELLRGPIEDGRQLDHLCRNRWCVNPDHLEPVTCRENIRRGLVARENASAA
jgi:hypothetical protein